MKNSEPREPAAGRGGGAHLHQLLSFDIHKIKDKNGLPGREEYITHFSKPWECYPWES